MNKPSLNEFFLVSLPGLEELALKEVADWFPDFECQAEYGGVTVQAPLAEGLAMNQALKIPTRILLRVDSFRVRDFPSLYKHVAAFRWRDWLDMTCTMEVFASSKKSRLKIKSRIEETCLKGWSHYQKERGVKHNPKLSAKLYVRIVEDECVMSLDTSGERLHKRGEREHIGEAPLRETIASALLQMCGRLAEPRTRVELIDPMAGSGTFLLEALYRDRVVDSREFAFETFAKKPAQSPRLRAERQTFAKLIGYEQDKKTLKAARHNLRDAEVQLIEKDFFKAEPLGNAEHSRWVICNPPYGERLKVSEPLDVFYAKLFAQVEKVAEPDLACFLLPAKSVKGKFLLPSKWKVLEKRPFLNGGLPVVAFVFGRK